MPAVIKLSVSVPARVWHEVERLFCRPGETRSALVTRVLGRAAREARSTEIAGEYERAYHALPETSEERAVHAALRDTTRTRFAELERQEPRQTAPAPRGRQRKPDAAR